MANPDKKSHVISILSGFTPDVPSKSWLITASDIPLGKRSSLSDKRYSSVVCLNQIYRESLNPLLSGDKEILAFAEVVQSD